jgi:hypothetical protein
MTTTDVVAGLVEAGFSEKQALALLTLQEQRGVTRDYLDSKLESLFNRLLIAGLTIAAVSIAVVTALGRLLG